MTTGSLIRTVSLAALLAATSLVSTAAMAADAHVPVIQVAASEATSRFIPLGIGKSVAIDLPSDIKDVLVADPAVANAVVRTSRRVYLIGVKVGQTNIFFFDAQGRQIAGFDIAVTRDLNGVRAALKQAMPDADIRIEGVGERSVMLTGSASSPAEAQQAFDIAAKLVGSPDQVVNGVTVRGRDQVMLKVTVAEVSRDVIKQLGIDLSGSLNYGTAVVNFNTSNPFSATGQALSGSSLVGAAAKNATGFPSVQTTLRAMERAGVIRTLAEPNLTAISGETASFMAGGEFPIPNGLSCDTTKSPPVCQAQVEFKKFGVSLMFTPVVLSEGRISLKVMTEVSDLSNQNSMTMSVPGSSQTLTIPSIRTRRADTVVEIPSGGSLAMAGMIQQQSQQSIDGIPGLMQVPVLGTLFKSRDFINHQSELMVLVTPYIVRAVAQKDLSRPDDGFADASDPSTVLLGRFNHIYGSAKKAEPKPAGTYHGKVGFILD
ncbi:MAG TPA: type II and III secretion system protein family protein [Pseudolabrys sp.]|jgi:pilus assembly protein CpaC|nr:type II and III secretion system protein family protein [Pseudolabrys sp.]